MMDVFRPKNLNAQGDNNLRHAPSYDSLELSWETLRSQRPVIVDQNQTGRQVTPESFFLCFIAFLELATGFGVLSVSILSIVRRYPYSFLIEIAMDITYFSIPGALLCFICFWIAISTMNEKNPPFLGLLIVFMIFSSILLLTGSYMGFVYKSKMKYANESKNELITTILKSEFVASMGESIIKYDTSDPHKSAWDITQRRLECCGILNASDWTTVRGEIPESCCKKGKCTLQNAYQVNCTVSVAYDIYWYNVFISYLHIIVVGIHVLSICITLYICYIWRNL